jgi:hypothetical protein
VQATDQRVPGNKVLAATTPLSNNFGARAALIRGATELSVAASTTANGGGIVSPWGSNPTFTSSIIKNNNLAGEKEVLLSYAQDLGVIGAEGVRVVAIYVQGWNAHSASTGERLPVSHELDVSLDYVVARGKLKGLWFRLQRNELHSKGDPEATTEWRAIVNWEIPLL